MDDIILTYLHTKIKPTLVPLYSDIITYLTDINYLEDKEDIPNLIHESTQGHITDDTHQLHLILKNYIIELSNTFGIIYNHDLLTIRIGYDILIALDKLSELEINEKLYIQSIVSADDISNMYKLVNIIDTHTLYDNISLNEVIDNVTPTLIENIGFMTKIDLTDDVIILLQAKLLGFMVSLSKEYIPLGASIFNETNDIDTKCVDLIKLYWDRVNKDYLHIDIYSLLILGRDSRLDILGFYREYIEDLIDENMISKVTNELKLLNDQYGTELKNIMDNLLDIEE